MSDSNFSVQNEVASTNSSTQGNSDIGNNLSVGGNVTVGNDVTVGGALAVTGVIEQNGVVLSEQATAPIDPTGTDKGVLWLQSGMPNKLIFTDDSGTDLNLSQKSSDHITIAGPVAYNVATATTDIIWGAEVGTSSATYTYTGGTSTVTVTSTGTYLITYNTLWENGTGATELTTDIALQVNAANVTNLPMLIPAAFALVAKQTIILNLTAGDALKVRVTGMLTTLAGNTFKAGNWSITKL